MAGGDFLQDRLSVLRDDGRFRSLPGTRQGIDFWSNDYLGFSRLLRPLKNGAFTAPGSRLISGDHDDITALEKRIARFHGTASALLFGSGYTANLGLLSSIGRRTDTFIYDERIHASLHDGIRLSRAAARRCKHNNVEQARALLTNTRPDGQTFFVTESRFSMDGDTAPLTDLSELCERYGALLIVDEAHSIGIDGEAGSGLVGQVGLTERVFARVVTYGKAAGFHGAAILGDEALRDYLVNFSRPFIFTTGPRPGQVAGVSAAYDLLESRQPAHHRKLAAVIDRFRAGILEAGLGKNVPDRHGPIQSVMVPGNRAVMRVEQTLLNASLLVKGIRSPSVAEGGERLRVCLHAFNTPDEVDHLIDHLSRTLKGITA